MRITAALAHHLISGTRVRLKVMNELENAVDVAIKALEQTSALDKIRAEIEQHRRKTQSIDPYDLVGDCLDILDKYKKESEDKL